MSSPDGAHAADTYIDPDGRDSDKFGVVCDQGGRCSGSTSEGGYDKSRKSDRDSMAAAIAEDLSDQYEAAMTPSETANSENAVIALIRIPLFFLMLDDRPAADRNGSGGRDSSVSMGGSGPPPPGRGGRRAARGASAVKVGGKPWRAHKVGEKSCRTGCDSVAADIQRSIGGELGHISPPAGAPWLGGVRDHGGKFVNPAGASGTGWGHHTVVVKNNRVYDALTGPAGEAINTYKSRFQYASALNWSF